MILSASRRTDIPAFYGKWFINRLKEGFFCVRNPFNCHQISKIIVDNKNLDCIVFWTKNAAPFMQYLDEIDRLGYKYYFQYTINGYDKSIESFIPDTSTVVDNFIQLSNRIGKERVIWRYDPILMTNEIDCDYHIDKFCELASKLGNYTKTVTISFLDYYRKTTLRNNTIRKPSIEEIKTIADKFYEIAKQCNLKINTCAENIIFDNGIEKASCIDRELIEKIIGARITAKKDANQRKECLCIESIDIGEYDTCRHLCEYCYANGGDKKIANKVSQHSVNSPLLVGMIEQNDTVKEKYVESLVQLQQSLFD